MPVKKEKKTNISLEQLAELEKLIIDDRAKCFSPETQTYRAKLGKWIKQLEALLYKEREHEDWETSISLPFTYTECETVATRIYQSLINNNDLVIAKPTGGEDVNIAQKIQDWFNWFLKNYIKGFDETLDRSVNTTVRLGMSILYSYYDRKIKKILHKKVFDQIDPENFLNDEAFNLICKITIADLYKNTLNIEQENAIQEIGKFKYKVKYLRKTPVASIKEEIEDTAILDFYPDESNSSFSVEIEENIVDYDGIRFKTLPLDNVWFPSSVKDNEELQECAYIGIEFETNYSEIVRLQKDGVYDLLTEEDLGLFKPARYYTDDVNKTIKTQIKYVAGIKSDAETDVNKNIRYYEVYRSYDINKDDINEEVLITYFPDQKKIARVKWLNQVFRSGSRPIDITNYSVREGTIYSYGVIELLSQIQEMVDILHNQFINNNTFATTPFGLIEHQSSFGSNFEKRNIKYKPMSLLSVDNVDGIKFPYIPNNQAWNLSDISLLINQGQEAAGINDIMLGKQQHSRTPVGSTLKMLAEANIRIKQGLIRYNRGLRSHLKKIYQLMRDYGPAEQTFRILGEDGKFQFHTITREDLQNVPDFDLGTSIDNLNKVYMREVWILLYQQVINPFLLQTGLIQNPQIYEFLKKIFESYDIKDYQKLINKPTENTLLSQEEETMRIMQGEDMEVNPLDNHIRHWQSIQKFKKDNIKMGIFPIDRLDELAAHEFAHQQAIIQQQQQMSQQAQQAQGPQNAPLSIQRPKAQPMQPYGGMPQGMMPNTT